MPFWPENASIFTIIKDAVIAAAAFTTAIVAARGLRTWHRKLKGGTEYDVARRLLRAAYKTRNAIQWLRYPKMSGWEFEGAQLAEVTEGGEKEFRALQFAYSTRWQQVHDAATELQAEQLEAETLWGEDFLCCVVPLHRCVHRMRTRVQLYLWVRNPAVRMTKMPEDTDQVLFGLPDSKGQDGYGEELSAAVKRIEDHVRPHLRMRKGPFTRLWQRLRRSMATGRHEALPGNSSQQPSEAAPEPRSGDWE